MPFLYNNLVLAKLGKKNNRNITLNNESLYISQQIPNFERF